MCQGNLQELQVRILIATHVDGNDLGNQFWIGKVLDMVMHENQNEIKCTKVHLYIRKLSHPVGLLT